LSHLERIAARAMDRQIPLSVLFELTGRCNLDCGHCYLDIAHPPPELSTAQAIAVVDQVADAGALFLTLSGGELFLRKDALEVARHARSRGLALRLFTNATRIDRALAREIAELRPLAVEISLYGADARRHDEVTQRRRSLRRTLRGALLLARAGVRVGLKAPILGLVAGEMDALARVGARIGAAMAFDPFVTPRHDGNVRPVTMRAETAALASALADPRLGWSKTSSLPPPKGPDDLPCAIARRTCRIDPSGNVYPCPTWPEPIGNALDRPLTELWQGGPLLDRLRAVRVRDLHGECEDCSQSGYCGRCMAVARIEHGDEMGPSRESCRVATAKELALGLPPRRVAAEGAGRVRLRVVG
jgi:radical SAM protein with 4Fe4S-binding SPASM domain